MTTEEINEETEIHLVSTEEIKEEIEKITQEEQEWKDCVEKLEKHCEKTWICLSDQITVYSILIEDCTGKQFAQWLNQIYPYLKDKKHDIEKYETDLDFKMLIFENLIGKLQKFQFPKQVL